MLKTPVIPSSFYARIRLPIRFGWIFVFICQTVSGQIRLPLLISDGMVLQRDSPIQVWGWAQPGELVEVTLNGQTGRATTEPTGKWTMKLPAMKAGGPYSMQIKGNNQITLTDILIGDVWLCSGQSNMAIPMERVKERYPDVIAQADNPAIRHFFLPTRYNFQTPMEDVPPGRWETATPQNVLRFTAIGYFFAKALFEKYHVPIGLINASVGGSPAEAWLSADALKRFPEHLATVEKLKDSAYVAGIQQSEKTAISAWNRRLRQQDKGWQGKKNWTDPAYDASAWPVMQLPGFWEDAGVPKGNGVVWFRKEIDVPVEMTNKPAKLFLGRIVDSDSVFINGTFVGTIGYQYPPRRYTLPANLLKPGKNTLVVRVINTAGKGGFIPDKPYQLIAGGQTINLKGPWQYQVGATAEAQPGTTFFQYKPEGLFNGMIAPLVKCALKGVIWYQGEANTNNADEYRQTFPAVIADWRQNWKQAGSMSTNFPFLFVQLANYLPVTSQPTESQWAELREAQRKTLSVPNTAMVVATDVGEWNDIHPLNKETVGQRLALAAEHLAYGDKTVVHSGPMYQSMKREGNQIVLTFSNTGSGLVAKDGKPLTHFAIAGSDNKFVWARATIKGNTVRVWSDQVPNPTTVRYAWADNPEGANLANQEGLPASPFTTSP
ncbi:sialate O-acetylesterase [Larkinella humicola]|uniref:Sialate O-acetylesterase n=1 Tax=Larkinella humicola TaxID=2607654 RepID=A0A5N1JHX6_9BACT|nr:sialate O-acetylesterase [Larkinella humicola]KAA9355309.1 sialate O-acetylesterase [Larkinella humicola]